jgi:hypothetical protein
VLEHEDVAKTADTTRIIIDLAKRVKEDNDDGDSPRLR